MSACAVPVAPPSGPGPVGEAQGRWRQQAHWIPMRDRGGAPRLLYTRVCRPPGDAPARVLVYNHGTAAAPFDQKPLDCDGEAMRWFLERGFIVVQPMRRGYGATGGVDSAMLAAGPQGLRSCDDLHPQRMALEAARDIRAAVAYATVLPGARPNGAVVIGASTGGYTALAFNSRPHPKVAAVVDVSGGIGGRFGGSIGQVCHPERMVEGAGRFGATAASPVLWLYATNDTFFSPDLGRAMFAAYTAAGGKGEFLETGVYQYDGHAMFLGQGGSHLWGPAMLRYLARQGAI